MQDPSEKATLDELYYQLVRELGYTWEEVMREKVPQTMYSFQKLREEAKKRKERREEVERKSP